MGSAEKVKAPTGLIETDTALRRHGELGTRWIAGMWRADPLADAVAADAKAAVREVRAYLAGELDGPPAAASAAALIAQVETDPDWLERERLDRAADVLVRYSAQWGLVLGAASLLRGAINPIAAKPLLLTGRYGSQPAVRSIEVGEWLSKVVSRGGMQVGAAGFGHTVRVRLIHAHVRRHIEAAGQWDHAAWGVPIPQPYMAFTLAEFGHISLAAMATIGVRLTADELDDIYHLWRYVGYLIGVDDELNPLDEAGHVKIEELYRLTSPGPDEYSREFVRALTEGYLAPELANLVPLPASVGKPLATSLMYGMSRVFLGEDAADSLAIPDGVAKHVVRLAAPGLMALDQVRMRVLGRERIAAASYPVRDRELARLKEQHAIKHDLVDAVPGAVGH